MTGQDSILYLKRVILVNRSIPIYIFYANLKLKVAASQIIPIAQWQQEEMILVKLRHLSEVRLLELTDFLDFLLQKEQAERQSA